MKKILLLALVLLSAGFVSTAQARKRCHQLENVKNSKKAKIHCNKIAVAGGRKQETIIKVHKNGNKRYKCCISN